MDFPIQSNIQPEHEEMIVDEQVFEIIRPFSHGSQGRIYLGKHKKTQQYVAIKQAIKQLVISKLTLQNHRCSDNFLEERTILKTLSDENCHPGFAKLLSHWDDEISHYNVMEFCQHDFFTFVKNLHDAQQRQRREQVPRSQREMPQPEFQSQSQSQLLPSIELTTVSRIIFRQLVDFLSWMHEKGYCHLDLHLENIMIYDLQKLLIKVIDFGSAKSSVDNSFMYNQTVGKREFMSPEKFSKKDFDGRNDDIWSLGVILFVILTGKIPFQSPSFSCQRFKMVMNGNLTQFLEKFKCLENVPKDAFDLLTKIFKFENERISMEDLKKHPFLQLDKSSSPLPIESEAKDIISNDKNNNDNNNCKNNNADETNNG